jgi:hypothetical protein
VADFTFNIAKGFEAYYASLPGANDSIIIVPLEATSLEADATLKDYDNLGALLAGSSNEQTTAGRKTAASVASTVDDTNEWRDIDFADPVWTALTGNPIGALLVCYKPDTASADGDIIPITKHDFAVTPNGGDVTAQVPTGGFLRIP